MECNWHQCNNLLVGQQKRFCSINCKNKFNVTKHRRTNKKKLVELFGGECVRCGYSKSLQALHFHHTDPNNKSFGIAYKGWTASFEKLVEEAKKCILICANCHAEEHDGV